MHQFRADRVSSAVPMTLAKRDMIMDSGIMLASQLISAIPSSATMGWLGFGPFSVVLVSLVWAALVSSPIAAIVFAVFDRWRPAGQIGSVLLGAACSIASFPVTYALKALWDGDSSGSWPGAVFAMLTLTFGVVAIATCLIPYLCGGLAGHLNWRRRGRHQQVT